MDLKSMLNESGPPPPLRLHTPQSSYDARTDFTPSSEHSSARPTSHSATLSSLEPRAQSGNSYFALHSPHPNSGSASTPGAGPSSVYAHSPGSLLSAHTPRDSYPPSTPYANHVPPSPSSRSSTTPGAHSHYQQHAPSAYTQPPVIIHQSQFHSPPPPPPPHASGLLLTQGRQISPAQQYHAQPITPLGPPPTHSRASPGSYRPVSQGHERPHKRESLPPAGATTVRGEQAHAVPTQLPRRQSSSMSAPVEARFREDSMSVSPKTIVRPSPYSQPSMSSALSEPETAPVPPPPQTQQRSETRETTVMSAVLPSSISMSPMAIRSEPPTSVVSATHHSPPKDLPGRPEMPVQEAAVIKLESPLDHSTPRAGSKRAASEATDTASEKPVKRIRRGEVPIWAQSARPGPLRFVGPYSGRSQPAQPQRPLNTRQESSPALNRPLPPLPNKSNGVPKPVAPAHEGELEPFEPSIAGLEPYEALSRCVADWVLKCIINERTPAAGGSIEIEAKLGQMIDTQSEARLAHQLPFLTETVFNAERYPGRSKFRSSMDTHQHELLNRYLNGLVTTVLQERSHGSKRAEIYYEHTHETDHFFELTPEGQAHLDPETIYWLKKSRHRDIKVRRTILDATGTIKKGGQIIKARLYDLDILDPRSDYDFRISISIEYPWQGDESWLTPLGSMPHSRSKDRMSYRHQFYQVDLTQVKSGSDQEHELEIEVATEKVRLELEKVRHGQDNKYETMIRGLLDNVRVLARKGSVNQI